MEQNKLILATWLVGCTSINGGGRKCAEEEEGEVY